jgi:hypothetical protein
VTGSELRYELKYRVDTLDAARAEGRLRAAPGAFFDEYPARTVHSVYFDTRDLAAYRDHVDGLGERAKVRLRWYGDAPGDAVHLEIKRREGALIQKRVVPHQAPGWHRRDLSDVVHALLGALPSRGLGLRVEELIPVVRISYERRYLATAAGLRATLDEETRVAAPEELEGPGIPLATGLLCELKFAPPLAGAAQAAAQALGWPRVRHSKYLRGVRELGLAGV